MEKISSELNKLMTEEKLFCDEDISLKRLSEILEIRPDQLSELINFLFHKNFNQYINSFRIEYAKELLILEKEMNILQIALTVGFNSKSVFNSEFKKLNKMTSSEFRKKNKSN